MAKRFQPLCFGKFVFVPSYNLSGSLLETNENRDVFGWRFEALWWVMSVFGFGVVGLG